MFHNIYPFVKFIFSIIQPKINYLQTSIKWCLPKHCRLQLYKLWSKNCRLSDESNRPSGIKGSTRSSITASCIGTRWKSAMNDTRNGCTARLRGGNHFVCSKRRRNGEGEVAKVIGTGAVGGEPKDQVELLYFSLVGEVPDGRRGRIRGFR